MKKNLLIHYDEEADFFELIVGKPTVAYYEDLGDEIFIRIDEKTKRVVGISIMGFKKRIGKSGDFEVKLPEKIGLFS